MTAARLARMHASLVTDAARLEAAARRTDDVDRRLQLLDDAAECRANAAALADVLARDPDVFVPDPRQISLLSDGGPTE